MYLLGRGSQGEGRRGAAAHAIESLALRLASFHEVSTVDGPLARKSAPLGDTVSSPDNSHWLCGPLTGCFFFRGWKRRQAQPRRPHADTHILPGGILSFHFIHLLTRGEPRRWAEHILPNLACLRPLRCHRLGLMVPSRLLPIPRAPLQPVVSNSTYTPAARSGARFLNIDMAWRCTGASNTALVENLAREDIIKSAAVKEAFLKVGSVCSRMCVRLGTVLTK